jgi:hypothetical protein
MTNVNASPSHWTYAPILPEYPDLQQGDILQPTQQLNAILGEIHPHFRDDKYSGFLVLSQTCDLVRRAPQNSCKANYINLAAIRPMQDVLIYLLDRHCSEQRLVSGVFKSGAKNKAKLLLQRVINQNEQSMGIFYLHPDMEVQIPDPSIALLQVSFALKADSHYDALVGARSGRLSHEFQCKLGWLIGNLYSRVATKDWSDSDRDNLVSLFLEPSPDGGIRPQWLDDKSAKKVIEALGQPLDTVPPEAIKAAVERLVPIRTKDAVIRRVADIAAQLTPPIDSQSIERLKYRLSNDMDFNSLFK